MDPQNSVQIANFILEGGRERRGKSLNHELLLSKALPPHGRHVLPFFLISKITLHALQSSLSTEQNELE